MTDKRSITPVFFIFLLFLVFTPAPVAISRELSWNFDGSDRIQGWKGEGIKAGGIEAGKLMIAGGEEVSLSSPPAGLIDAATNPYLRIRLRVQSPRVAQFYWIPDSPGRRWPALTFQPGRDGRFHTYWLKLSGSPRWRGKIKRFGLIFQGRPGLIEIDSIEIGPFSLSQYLADQWAEFWLPRRLTPGTINSLNSPQIFGRPFISWLNKIALAVIIIGAFLYFRAQGKRRVRVFAKIALILLIIWVIYDIRETYNQYAIAKEIYQSYVQPPPGEKTFPALGDFYHFVDFCRSNIPRNSIFQLLPQPFWPFDCRLKYFLYPSWIESEKTDAYIKKGYPRYFIVYRAPFIRFDPASKTLVRESDHAQLTPPGRVTANYNSNSFIFKVH